MTTSRSHNIVRPIIRQRGYPPKPASIIPTATNDSLVDSTDVSYERLPPLEPSSKDQPIASTSTLQSTTSVNTYNSLESNGDGVRLYNSNSKKDDAVCDDAVEEPAVKFLPNDAAIPRALPIYNLPPINDYPVRPTSPEFFGQLFPTLDRLTVRHDDLTPDGNMNLRIETRPHFLLPHKSASGRSRHQKRPVAFQLFHLRMHDLARRDFSLRRYCRDSGREICSSKRAFIIEGQQNQQNHEDADNEKQDKHLSRPGTSGGSIQRSVSTAFKSVKTPFQRSSNGSSLFRRPGMSSNSRQSSSSASSWDAPAYSADLSTDKLSTAPSTAPSCRLLESLRPVKQATDTIKLEFSNYARVDITRNKVEGSQDMAVYNFEWWGHTYNWRRVVDEHTGMVSYHLMRDGSKSPVAHIVPETRGLEEMKADEAVGGWVPPCHIWISDESVIHAMTDVADVIMATGLITLVDDCIHSRWQIRGQPGNQGRPQHPIKSYTGDIIPVRPKGLLSSIFQRRRSEQHSSNKPLTAF